MKVPPLGDHRRDRHHHRNSSDPHVSLPRQECLDALESQSSDRGRIRLPISVS